MTEETSAEIARIAAIGLQFPTTLTWEQVQKVCASVLTQRPDHVQPEPSDDKSAILEQVALIAEAAAEIKLILKGG